MAEGGPPDCATQKSEIANLLKQSMQKNDIWFLIDIKWFKQWKKFVGYDEWDSHEIGDETINPGPIDNTTLLNDKGELKESLVDDMDYMLVPTSGWNKLLAWYSSREGQIPVPRRVIEEGVYLKQLKVEVYLFNLSLKHYGHDNKAPVIRGVSRTSSVGELEMEMRKEFGVVANKEVRLWNMYMSSTYERLNKPENTLQDAGLYQGQIIVIEEKNEDGTWPRQLTTRLSSSGDSSFGSYDKGYSKGNGTTSRPGLCGLANLGNTCFMNSALQCMSNVPLLTDFMLSGKWERELNEENPLGNKGEIARSYADLMKSVWSGRHAYTVPRNFKVAVGRFAPQFSGYQQQDSQELMAFLLDGLHEDLNRITKKPYIEVKDDDGRPDSVVAKEAWGNYRKRNDSIIVDIFHGLLKSTVQCPECDRISVTFDPFCYLSLPLPMKKERQLEIFWVPMAPNDKPIQFKLTVPKMGIVADVCKALSTFTDVPPEKMVVTDVYNHRFHRIYALEDGLNHILDRDDIFIYEVPLIPASDPNVNMVPIYLREKRTSGHDTYVSSNQLFGQPLLLPISKDDCSYEKLYAILLQKMCRYVTTPDPNDKWWLKVESMNDDENSTSSDMQTVDDVASNSTTAEVNGVSNMDTTMSDDETEQSDAKPQADVARRSRMFSFSQVNSYGSSVIDSSLKDNGMPLKLAANAYLALDWDPLAKSKFYVEKEAEDFEQHESIRFRNVTKKQVFQLDECLQIFVDAEKLSAQDPWYCPSCKKHQQATKKFDIWSLPNVLIIHLKRFSYNRYWRDKIDAVIDFPIQGLDLRKYVINGEEEPPLYDLIAVSNHYGGLGGGHYTAFAKNKENNSWHYFDDSSVNPSTEEAIVTKAAYVLIYERREQKSRHVSATSKMSDASATNGLDTDHSNDDDVAMDESA